MTIQAQYHEQFKLFTGKLDDAGHISELASQVAAWAKPGKFAAKSIGIEFIEHSKSVIISIGYREHEPGYAVSIASAKIGKLGELDKGEIDRIERALGKAAQNQKNVICHELYVTDKNELYMVTMHHE